MKKIVITGATSGIGNGLVKLFSKDNIVFAGYRNEKYINDLKSISPNVIPFYINFNENESIKSAAEFIKSQTDIINTLINAAGCVVAGIMEKIDVERVKEQFEVNTFSHLDFTQRLMPLIVDGGKIINISSMASFGIFPFVAPYCASKRAMDILFNALMLETHKNIKVVSVKPGVIATPLWSKSVEGNKSSIENCSGYEKEMEYMVSGALKNEKSGLSPQKVIDLIEKIEKTKNPKPSYTVGKDAFAAQLLSKLPFCIQNTIIKYGMKLKMSKCNKL